MRRNPLVAGVAVAIGLALFAFVVVLPRGEEVGQLEAKVAGAEADLGQLEGELATLEAIDPVAIKRDLSALRAQIPSSAALPDLLRLLGWAADAADVTITSIGVGAGGAASGVSVSVLSLTVAAEGDYFGLARFFFELEHLGRLGLVRSISLTPSAGRGLSASIALEVYSTDLVLGPGTGAETGAELGQ